MSEKAAACGWMVAVGCRWLLWLFVSLFVMAMIIWMVVIHWLLWFFAYLLWVFICCGCGYLFISNCRGYLLLGLFVAMAIFWFRWFLVDARYRSMVLIGD